MTEKVLREVAALSTIETRGGWVLGRFVMRTGTQLTVDASPNVVAPVSVPEHSVSRTRFPTARPRPSRTPRADSRGPSCDRTQQTSVQAGGGQLDVQNPKSPTARSWPRGRRPTARATAPGADLDQGAEMAQHEQLRIDSALAAFKIHFGDRIPRGNLIRSRAGARRGR
jgi:hypothetical protein